MDSDIGLNIYDSHARLYDPQVPRFLSMDPHAERYYNISPYVYAANNPLNVIDPDGMDIHMYFYVDGHDDEGSDKAFWTAALTRAYDLLNSKEYGDGDIAVMHRISDLGKLGDAVSGIVSKYGDKYGKTKEFGIWSHASLDGPIGTELTSKNSFDGKQLSLEGWSNINFNWVDYGSVAGFYGCRTGAKDGITSSFNENISSLSNMKDVSVLGQTSRSWPSSYADARLTTDAIRSNNHTYPTYFVGSYKRPVHRLNSILSMPSYANPMSIYKNGTYVGQGYQMGRKLTNQ